MPAKLIPNNNGGGESAEWGETQKTKYSLAKRESDPAVRAAYESVYGPYKYSGVIIELEYQLTEPTTDTKEIAKEEVSGDWKFYITWYKQSTGDKIKNKFKQIQIPNFSMKQSGQSFVGIKVETLCPVFN